MANRLSFLRRIKGIKQCNLAKALDISPSFLCKIEKGLFEPTDILKEKCAFFFNEDIESIFLPDSNNKPEFLTKIGSVNNHLWSVRSKKNIKQNKLAELIGCSPSYLSKIEKGLQEPNAAFKKKCAKILKIKETELFPDK
ncbi:MAG: helix-turn-helix domain-containing protein [Leptospirales bacterium]|nr:helix-turn-helix domain-containing protein [Leptospirales bacterium]